MREKLQGYRAKLQSKFDNRTAPHVMVDATMGKKRKMQNTIVTGDLTLVSHFVPESPVSTI